MRFEPLAPIGATAHTNYRGRDRASPRTRGAAGKERPPSAFPLIGRSLFVCTALAAGFTSTIVALGWQIDGLQPAQAATPSVVVDMPKPRVALAPNPFAEPMFEKNRALDGEAVLAHSRIDRVPSEFLMPEEDAAVPDLSEVARGLSDPNELLEFGPMRVKRHLVETILRGARVTNADPALLMAIADKESSFLSGVQARTSSATGLFQFIERTWLQVVHEFGAKHGLEKEARSIARTDEGFLVEDAAERERILELRRDPYLSTLLAADMLARDRARIARTIGRDLTQGETYLAHFLGPDDAERFLAKVGEEPKSVASKLLPKPARANKPIFFARKGRKTKGLSVAEVHRKFEAMMDLRLARYRNVQQIVDAKVYADARTQ
jgi:hypothetical protein